ncbi:MAG: hypothetical protein AOA65_1915 [Candidatus Bathyarchaeota archaeon BA1]|nr:MAG: hypothetical protein AOA65_1915 [Candidatus Bathyarchaeota archaeon BA1]
MPKGVEERLAGLERKVTSLKGEVTSLKEEVAGLREKVAGLEGVISEMGKRINDLRHTLTVYSTITWAILAAILARLLIS